MLQGLIVGVQLFFSIVIGMYFLLQLKGQTSGKANIYKDGIARYEKMNRLRNISLTEPLSERVRPKEEADIIGQEDGLKALKIALCGSNPQHILIYGSPGIGKTAAARIALEVAKASTKTPFKKDAKFIEIDATTLRFDERSIADPLIGSVHDPIYQGAGAYGQAGVPQPKPGAVTKAHGGVLFIDEIGELHGTQMNKLLKVLEDRKVFLDSAYYSEGDENIPKDIHDIFRNGLPADFRLIGATTRNPEDIPSALRSRCVEIFFKDLTHEDILNIVNHTAEKEAIQLGEGARDIIATHCRSGRDAVNILQTAYSLVGLEDRDCIEVKDVEWIVQNGHYSPRLVNKVQVGEYVGKVNGLAVANMGGGLLLEIEAVAAKVEDQKGTIKVTGIIEEEDLHLSNSTAKRRSMVSNSIENVLTVLKMRYNVNTDDYLLHINFPSGMPIDGPSAGTAIFSALYSAVFNKPIAGEIAMTGEISVQGQVRPVGGVYEKILAAKEAGAKKVFIPVDNMKNLFENLEIQVVPVKNIEELIELVFEDNLLQKANKALHA